MSNNYDDLIYAINQLKDHIEGIESYQIDQIDNFISLGKSYTDDALLSAENMLGELEEAEQAARDEAEESRNGSK